MAPLESRGTENASPQEANAEPPERLPADNFRIWLATIGKCVH
jgi:hypothetical protein